MSYFQSCIIMICFCEYLFLFLNFDTKYVACFDFQQAWAVDTGRRENGVSDNDFILLSWFALKHFPTIELWLPLLLFRRHHHNRNGDNNSAPKCEKLRGRVYVNDHFDSTHPKMKGILWVWAFLNFVQNTIRLDWSWAYLCLSVLKLLLYKGDTLLPKLARNFRLGT